MVTPAELVAPLAELIASSAAWLVQVTRERKNPKERLAAQILYEAGLLVALVRELDNAGRRVAAPFAAFEPDWTDSERRAAFEAVSEYVHDLTVTAGIGKSLAVLRYYEENASMLDTRVADEIAANLATIIRGSESILREMTRGSVLCKPQFADGLDDFWAGMKNARSEDEARRIAAMVRSAFAADTAPIVKIEEAFGQLKGVTLSAYPHLPPPAWAG